MNATWTVGPCKGRVSVIPTWIGKVVSDCLLHNCSDRFWCGKISCPHCLDKYCEKCHSPLDVDEIYEDDTILKRYFCHQCNHLCV